MSGIAVLSTPLMAEPVTSATAHHIAERIARQIECPVYIIRKDLIRMGIIDESVSQVDLCRGVGTYSEAAGQRILGYLESCFDPLGISIRVQAVVLARTMR